MYFLDNLCQYYNLFIVNKNIDLNEDKTLKEHIAKAVGELFLSTSNEFPTYLYRTANIIHYKTIYLTIERFYNDKKRLDPEILLVELYNHLLEYCNQDYSFLEATSSIEYIFPCDFTKLILVFQQNIKISKFMLFAFQASCIKYEIEKEEK